MKSKSDIALGRSKVAPMSNLEKFDETDQTARYLFATPEDFPSPSRFDLPTDMPESGYASESVEFSSNPTSVPEPHTVEKLKTCPGRKKFAPNRQHRIMSCQSVITSPNYVPEFEHNGNYELNNS